MFARLGVVCGPLAQLVEQLTLNQQVQSSRLWRLRFNPKLLADIFLWYVILYQPEGVIVSERARREAEEQPAKTIAEGREKPEKKAKE